MLCCICITEDIDPPNNAVAYMYGSSLCREHVKFVAAQRNFNSATSPQVQTFVKALTAAIGAQRTNGTNVTEVVVDD